MTTIAARLYLQEGQPAGLGYGTGAHAPNEVFLVEPGPDVSIAGLAEIEKAYVDMIFALAGDG